MEPLRICAEQPPLTGDPSGLDCVYLDSGGNGVESIDHNSDIGECQQNNGFWAYGWVGGNNWVKTNPNSDEVTIDSFLNGQMDWTKATQQWSWGAFPYSSFAPPGDNSTSLASWTLSFTNSFLTFSGGPGNIPTCAEQTLKSMGNELLFGSASGATVSAETTLKAASIKQAARAATYAAAQPNSLGGTGLICPRCSSVFRSMMSKAEVLGEASEALPLAEVSIAAGKSIPEVGEQAREGTCAAAFPIF
jgi:hypothetical protein